MNINTPVRGQYDEWLGTISADDGDEITTRRSAYEILGIDESEWTIVGFGFTFGRMGFVTAYATKADEDGDSLDVTAFDITKVKSGDFIDEYFKRFGARVIAKGYVRGEVELNVVNRISDEK